MTTNIELAAAKRFLEGLSDGVTPTPVLCAVSGGRDSMCLLHLLSTWGRQRGLCVTAAHFNHLHRDEESYRDECFVRDRCAEEGIPFVWGRADIRAHAAESGQTLEEAGRDLRYAFLEEQRAALGCVYILTAHHADDNAETMLLNLLRGTGTRGLTGIPERRGDIARPFLRTTREELAAYAAQHHIKYVEDTTNALDVAARNVLRNHVLPVLREVNPRAVENMARAADRLKEDHEALARMAETLEREACRFEDEAVFMNVEVCRGAERALVKRAVHAALARMGGHRKDLTARHVEAVCELLEAPAGKTLSLPYGLTARREKTELAIFRTEEAPEAKQIQIGETVSFGKWTVRVTKEGPGLELTLPPETALTVTAWDRDDRMLLPGSRGARSLKRLCADRGISPAERDALPVLRVDGVCAAVPGIGIHSGFLSGIGQTVYLNFQSEERDYEK